MRGRPLFSDSLRVCYTLGAMAQPSRSYNPIHFEDLEPKRFEDLVRERIYDFKSWQTIEATGRGGDGAGFDDGHCPASAPLGQIGRIEQERVSGSS